MFLTRFEVNTGRRGARKLLGSPHAMHAAVLCAFPEAAHDPFVALLPADVPDTGRGPEGRGPEGRGPEGRGTSAEGRVLWRLDQDGSRAVLYVLSPRRPDLSHLVEQAGWPAGRSGPMGQAGSAGEGPSGWDTRSYQPLLDRIAAGQVWAFRIAANPTKNVRLPRKPREAADDRAVDRQPASGGSSDAAGPSGEEADQTAKPRSQRVAHVTAAQQTDWLLSRAASWGFEVPDTEDGGPAVVLVDRRRRTFSRQGASVELGTAVFDGRLRVVDPDVLRGRLVTGFGPAKGYGCGLMTLAPAQARSSAQAR